MASQSLLQIFDFLEYYKVVFVQNVPERLKCILCKEILKNAKQTSCGCKVCERCIREYLKEEEKPCPSKLAECCDTKLMLKRDIHQDNATNKEIGNLQIECPFKNCNTKDVIKNMVNHVDICEYREVSCDKCSKKYPLKEKMKHDKEDCDSRIVKCDFCYKTMTAIVYNSTHLNKDHEELCSKYVKECPNKIFKNLKRNEVPEIKMLTLDLQEDLSQCSTFFKEQLEIITELKPWDTETQKSIEELKKTYIEGELRDKSSDFRNGKFIWKITNLKSLKNNAESGRASMTSDPFYTSEFGYKMCLKVYPNGDGIGRGTHLSVFFAIMKGEYDDILAWPFTQNVTLSLLDQENKGIKNNSIIFKPDAQSPCCQKPVDDYNIALGSPKFIPLSYLLPISLYCQNNTIYIKISVDTTEIIET